MLTTMKLMSVNVGARQSLGSRKTDRETGICKTPVPGPTAVTHAGLTGDVICNDRDHGGPDQAVYLYGEPDYEWWSAELGYEIQAGEFGENLTISDLESSAIYVGDRFHVGSTVLEVTAPRIPCETLARRMNDPLFVKRFRDAERPGLYCRVLEEGRVQRGDDVTYERHSGDSITTLEMFRLFYVSAVDEVTLLRHLAAPIDIRSRVENEEKLRKLRMVDA